METCPECKGEYTAIQGGNIYNHVCPDMTIKANNKGFKLQEDSKVMSDTTSPSKPHVCAHWLKKYGPNGIYYYFIFELLNIARDYLLAP